MSGMLATITTKFFLILIVRAYCGDSFERIKSIEILLIQKGEIFVIVLSTGATERYILFLYPFLDYMRPKTRNDKKKKITISIKVGIIEFFSLGIKKECGKERILFKLINRAGVIHEGVQFHFFYYTTYIILKNKIEFVVESFFLQGLITNLDSSKMYSVSFITDYPLFDFLFIRYYFMLTN
ncbi:hypothetical protein ACJX0J_001011 [Zea mays]